ncbi:MAG: hypothetical protein ABI910_12665 [Gemmatimonadota bacterium]
MPRRRWIGSGVVVVSAFLMAGVLAEPLVRFVRPQQLILRRPDIWRPDSVLGWSHVPDVMTTVNTGEGVVEWASDVDGFRVGENGRVDGKYAVLMLGDSFVEAMQVPHERTVSGLLQTRLSRSMRLNVSVRNAGVGGWAPDQYLLRSRQVIASQPIDLVLVTLYLGNDAIDFRREIVPRRLPARVHHLRLPRSLRRNELVDAVLYPINDFLEVRSHLYVLGRNRLQHVRMRLGLSAQARITALDRSEALSSRWSNTASICNEIAEFARDARIPVLFVLVPAPHQVDPRILDQYLEGFAIDSSTVDIDQPNRLLARELRSRKLDVIDVLEPFRRATQAGESLYGAVDPHLSAAGHELLEEMLEKAVADRLPR